MILLVIGFVVTVFFACALGKAAQRGDEWRER